MCKEWGEGGEESPIFPADAERHGETFPERSSPRLLCMHFISGVNYLFNFSKHPHLVIPNR